MKKFRNPYILYFNYIFFLNAPKEKEHFSQSTIICIWMIRFIFKVRFSYNL